jgi:putative tricarboxylic transport membrane protein
VYIIFLPDGTRLKVLGSTLNRIIVLLVLLSAYAYLFEPLGFILSTTLFCLVLSKILGATALQSVLFGVASGGFGYLLCAVLLDLNLPEGIILKLLRGLS